MLHRLREAGLVWPTAVAVPALAILIGLGSWQWQRMAWKAQLLDALRASTDVTPVPFETWRRRAGQADRDQGDEFLRVVATGVWRHDRSAFAYTIRNGRAGYNVFTPLVPEGGADGEAIVVNRGFIAEDRRGETALAGEGSGRASEVVARVRLVREDSMFTPEPDSAQRIAYGVFPTGLLEPAPSPVAGGQPIYLEAEPVSGVTDGPRPRTFQEVVGGISNRHLEYALTWWGLAATLVGVYIAFVNQRLRARPR